MKIETMVTAGCEGVQNAIKAGHLHNQDLFRFAFSKAIIDLPDHDAVYLDFRRLDVKEHQPNFFILNQKSMPEVIFIGMLRYYPSSISVIEKDLSELRLSTKQKDVTVWVDQKEWMGKEMPISQYLGFGYFIITNLAWQIVEQSIQKSLSNEDRFRFHFAYGTCSPKHSLHLGFRYHPPRECK